MFRVLFLYQHEHVEKFSNLHYCTFKSESETVDILNKFFSNIVKNFGILVYDNFGPIIKSMKHLAYKAISKYKNKPSILAVKDT